MPLGEALRDGEDAARDGDVLAEENHARIARELLVERIEDAAAELSSPLTTRLRVEPHGRRGVRPGRRARAFDDLADLRVDLGVDAVELRVRGGLIAGEDGARQQERVALLPCLKLAGLAVGTRIAAAVPDDASHSSRNTGPWPETACARARAAASRTATTSFPSTTSVVMPSARGRSAMAPAVTVSIGLYSM